MAELSATRNIAERTSSAAPYPAGWADRVTDRVDRLPLPAWAFYLLVWLGLFSVETSINWYSGVYPVGTFFLYHLIFTGLVIYGLALVHYFDKVAGDALVALRPALTGTEAEFDRLHYEISTMPARSSIVAVVAGIVLGIPIVLLFADSRTLALTKAFDTPPSMVLNIILLFVIWCLMGLYSYHTVRQLLLVNRVYATATRVDLFRRQPLYAFSGLAARTALSWAVLPYAGIISRPGITENLAVLWTSVVMTVVALIIFAWPLWGVHRLMEAEKKRLLDENGVQLSAAMAETHRRMKAHDLSDMGGLKDAFDNLVSEQAVINKIPTWPWQNGTLGILITALVLPVVLWILERVLERLWGI